MRTHPRHPRARLGLATVAIALPLLAVGATTSGATAADDRSRSGQVTGRVVDSTGRPVAGAMVNVLGPAKVPEKALGEHSRFSTTTDADGRFAVAQNGSGYLVQVCQPSVDRPWSCDETVTGVDYVITYAGPDGTTDSWLLQRSLFDALPGDRALGTIAVGRPSEITGRVTGASFDLVQLRRMNGSVAFNMRTDGDGDYAFKGLVAGRYYVTAGGAGWLPWASEPVTIDPDHPAVVDTTLDQGAVVEGRAISGGRPASSVPLLVQRRDGTPVAATQTGPRGTFRLQGFTPGTYRVTVDRGSDWAPARERVVVPEPNAHVSVELAVVKGATVTLRVVEDGKPARSAVDELRRHGRPYATRLNDDGTLTYRGLPPGRYSVVVAGEHGYGARSFRVTGSTRVTLRDLDLDEPFLTVRGRTAPHATVEITTSDLCPPDGAPSFGAFAEYDIADARGRFTVHGLVPGSFMVGSDAYPADYAPRCLPDVQLTRDTVVDVPLDEGEHASGRLVYADGGDPVITTLSYELLYPAGSTTNPVEEHPARSRTHGATGSFEIVGLAAGEVTGRLAAEADGDFTDADFFPIHPYQDGTPYWLDTAPRQVSVGSGDGDLGDIPLTLHTGS
ncbi:MAG: carboxypeptidase regulatory-like domain-containing protein [Nocardioides sp.]|nr:carboxypeptidase regulatory-like domain-containing protein [Nocardioidaceae bacterium]MCB8955296.1 carboxypeptidase regulatory-like domain-containing protein [Nocardioides sp.]